MSNEDIRSKTVQFEQMVNDIVIAGGDGPKFNENSETYVKEEVNKHKQAVNGEIIRLPGANPAKPAHGANPANHAQNHGANHAAGPGMH